VAELERAQNELEPDRAEDPWSKRCCLSDGTAFSAAVRDPHRPSSSSLVASRLVSAALVAFRPFPSRRACYAAPRIRAPPPSLRTWRTHALHRVSRISSGLLHLRTPEGWRGCFGGSIALCGVSLASSGLSIAIDLN
jgi:hypothetical protein